MELISTLAPYILAIIGAALTFIFTKDKYKAEIAKAKAENALLNIDGVQKIIKMWEGIAQGLTQELKEVNIEMVDLKRKIKHLEEKLDKSSNQKPSI